MLFLGPYYFCVLERLFTEWGIHKIFGVWGGLVNQIPLTLSCLNTANLTLCGVPFLAGFYSRDLILEVGSMAWIDLVRFFLLFFSTGLTVCYSVRLSYYLTGMGVAGMSCHGIGDNSNLVMVRGMLGLTVASILGGIIMRWLLFSCSPVVVLPLALKIGALIVRGVGAWVGFLLGNSYLVRVGASWGAAYFFISIIGSMWFLPYLSTSYCIRLPLNLGGAYVKVVDQGWSEILGPQGTYNFIASGSGLITRAHFNEFGLHLFFSFTLIMFLIIIIFIIYLNSLSNSNIIGG